MDKLLRCQTEELRDASSAISDAASLLSDVVSDYTGSDEWPQHWHPGRIVAVLDLINHAAHGQYLTLSRVSGKEA